MGIFRRMRECRSGAAAVEFALAGLLLVPMSIGVIDFNRGLYVRNHLSYAMDNGARAVLMRGSTSNAALESAIRGAYKGPQPSRMKVIIGSETVSGATYRTATIEYPLTLNVPGLTSRVINLRIARRIPVL